MEIKFSQKNDKRSKECGADAVKFQKKDIDDILNFGLKENT